MVRVKFFLNYLAEMFKKISLLRCHENCAKKSESGKKGTLKNSTLNI